MIIGLVIAFALAPAKILLQRVFETSGGLPRCESPLAETEVKRTVENSPAGHRTGVRVAALVGSHPTGDEPGVRRCAAVARLNSGQNVNIAIVFTKGDAQHSYFINVKPATSSEPARNTSSPAI